MNWGSFLSNESRFGRAMTKCATIIAINLMFALTCIPFVTAGAAFAAMYHAMFEVIRADASRSVLPPANPFKAYWEGLRRNFLRATLSWLAFAAVMAAGYMDLMICRQAGGALRVMSAGVIAVMIAAVLIIMYLLPLMTQLSGKMTELVKISVFAAMSRPLTMVLVLVLNCTLPVLLYLDEINKPAYAFAGTFFAFGLGAWIIAKMLYPRIRELQGNSDTISARSHSFAARCGNDY